MARGLAEPLTLLWPSGPVTSSEYQYYIALYFADDQTSASGSSRTLDVNINGVSYYKNLIANPAGVVVFANQWPLGGITNLTLSPAPGSTTGPLINGGEVFQVIPSGGRTIPRDGNGLAPISSLLLSTIASFYSGLNLEKRFSIVYPLPPRLRSLCDLSLDQN